MRDDAHAVATAQIGYINLTEPEGLHVAGRHCVQKPTEGGTGLEPERVSEAGAPGSLDAEADGDFEDSEDRGSLGEWLHNDTSVGGFGSGWLRRAIGAGAGGVGAAVAFAGDGDRRLANAAHGAEFGTLHAHLAGSVVGEGATAAGVEGVVTAVGVLGLIGGETGNRLDVEAKLDLSD